MDCSSAGIACHAGRHGLAATFLFGLMIYLALQTAYAANVSISLRTFKTSRLLAPKVKSEYCRERPFYRVNVLRNAEGDIGAYVLQPAIRDAAIPYLDAEGMALTTFHIFGSDAEKQDAMAIITPLRSRFPVEVALDCQAP